jgi:hypothetical protein
MQFNVGYAPPAFIRLLRRKCIAPLLQKQPHAGGRGAFRRNEVSLAGDGEMTRLFLENSWMGGRRSDLGTIEIIAYFGLVPPKDAWSFLLP